jgi:hypothetical protein
MERSALTFESQRGDNYRRPSRKPVTIRHPLSFIAVAALLCTMLIQAGDAQAQQPILVDGIEAEILELAPASDKADRQMVLMRMTLEPEVTLRRHSHPGIAVLMVISGVLNTELVRGDATISRVSANGSGTATTERVEVRESVKLNPGDIITLGLGSGKTMANGGQEPLVLVAFLIIPAEEPILTFDPWPRTLNPHLR